jgi:hypothetical protein
MTDRRAAMAVRTLSLRGAHIKAHGERERKADFHSPFGQKRLAVDVGAARIGNEPASSSPNGIVA